MKNKKLLSCLIAVFAVLGISADAQSPLISQMPDGIGKQIVSIHSFSAQTKHQEGAANLLLPDQSGNEDKWCDNSSEKPWVIFELSDYYNIDKIVIRDACIRELKNGNVAEYKIYVTTAEYDKDKVDDDFPAMTGWNSSDWKEAYHGEDEGDLEIKTIEFDAPEKARYIKLVVLNKGFRNDNGDAENAVRIYGFDIYGSFAESIDRGDLISVGKTVLAYYKAANNRERPANLLDGNLTNANSKWCFSAVTTNEPYPYVVFDLEKQYDITGFKVHDCKVLEDNSNFGACDISISETMPDLSKISVLGDENTNWTVVVDNEDAEDQFGIDVKEYNLDAPLKGRFVKFIIPQQWIQSGQATRVYQFEVYGNEAAIDADDATLAVLAISQGSLNPTFDPNHTDYTVNLPKEVESITVNASANHSLATLTGSGEYPLVLGANPISIKVKAANGITEKEYKITVNRAEKSDIATLDSLQILTPGVYLASEFISDSLNYIVDARHGVSSFRLRAVATQANAVIVAEDEYQLTGDETELTITVTSESGNTANEYKLTVYKSPENLFSVNFGDPKGKRIVNIHSCSGKAHDEEAASKLLIGKNQNTNGNKRNKWCYKGDQAWVVFSLTDIYEFDKIVFRNGSIMNDGTDISGYEILFSTTTADINDYDAWETVAYDADGGYGEEVTVNSVRKMEAKYVLFKPVAVKDNTVWIYGFDMYGKLSEKADRDNLVSVGKTIVDYSTYASHRETPQNIIDGNIDYLLYDENGEETFMKCEPWAFNLRDSAAYVIIDLEEEYNNIKEFKLYDQSDWLKGYKVSLSSDGTTWALAAEKTFEPEVENELDENGDQVFDDDGNAKTTTVGPVVKTITLDEPKAGRYVKVDFPVAMQSTNWNRIREFEVYTDGTSGLNSISSNAAKLTIYPNPVQQGNDVYVNATGDLQVYTLQGALVYEKTISGAAYIPTVNFAQGSYIIRLSNKNEIQQAKLVIK